MPGNSTIISVHTDMFAQLSGIKGDDTWNQLMKRLIGSYCWSKGDNPSEKMKAVEREVLFRRFTARAQRRAKG